MTPARIDTSSAETGSSSTSTFGVSASARAMPMRCRWPPENSCGNRELIDGSRPTSRSSSLMRFVDLLVVHAVRAHRLGEDVADRQPRVERGHRVLEDDLQVAADRDGRGRRSRGCRGR